MNWRMIKRKLIQEFKTVVDFICLKDCCITNVMRKEGLIILFAVGKC